MYLILNFFFRHLKKEVDFIASWYQTNCNNDWFLTNKNIIAIEVKYKNNITKKDLKGLLYFCEKFNVTNKVVFVKDKIDWREGIKFIPFWEVENFTLS